LIRVAERHVGLYCGKIIGEYLEKLVDRGHPKDRITKFVALIMGSFCQIDIVSHHMQPAPADKDDEVFLACAIDGVADFLVSNDKSLLDLAAHYQTPVIGNSDWAAGVILP
jgi:predicted nucleic acid-binding protein